MNSLIWKEEKDILYLYEDDKCVFELFIDEEGYWVAKSQILEIYDSFAHSELYDKEMAKLTVITLWLTSNIKKDDINWEGCF